LASDPCWDIEHSEGFEAHHDERVASRKEWEAKWAAERQAVLEKRAEALGCPGNDKLSCYVECLEHQLERMQERIETLEAGTGRF